MKRSVDTPVGPVTIEEESNEIISLRSGGSESEDSALFREAEAQLAAYFAGRQTRFTLPLRLSPGLTGAVQREMLAIPFGQTRTYGDLARTLATPAQAIGQACGANPVPVLIPCHRILSATGLGGFSFAKGAETKAFLLRLEGAMLL